MFTCFLIVLWLAGYKPPQWNTNVLFFHITAKIHTLKLRIFPWYLIGIWQHCTAELWDVQTQRSWSFMGDSQRLYRTRELRIISSQLVLAKGSQVSPATSGKHHWFWLWHCTSVSALSCQAVTEREKLIRYEGGHSTEKIFHTKYL